MNCNTQLSCIDRVQKAAEILKTKQSVVEKALEVVGIEIDDDLADSLLDAESTTEKMLSDEITKVMSATTEDHVDPKPARVAAAVAVLKGRDPFKKADAETSGKAEDTKVFLDSSGSTLTETMGKIAVALSVDNRLPSQLKDHELLARYVAERDYECERELDLRAKGQPFIVLKDVGKHEPGKEPIDVEESLALLKRARRGKVNNTIVPYGDKVANVYRVTELNMDDRKVELCPICGESLYKGYCEKCEMSFQTIGKFERAYMKLIVDHSGRFQRDSFADRKALHASAVKGLDDLRSTWPSMSKLFDDLKESDDLPKLVIIGNRPSRRVADPFHVAGNRSY
jgi:mRNA-degrading endonuclease YafQ of YafQ-DinJ toxin-antitoxin module